MLLKGPWSNWCTGNSLLWLTRSAFSNVVEFCESSYEKSKQTERFSDNQTDDHNAYPRLVCPDLWTGWWCNAIRIKRLTLCGINWNEIKHDLLQGCVNGTAIDCATGWNKPPSHEQSRAESAADLLSGLVLPHWDNPIVPIVPVRRWILGSVKLSV